MYGAAATAFVARIQGRPLLFFVSNPPFLGLLGPTVGGLRGWPYVVLVYDVYPDAFERFGRIPEGGVVATGWRMMQRAFLERASAVFTIGECMAERLALAFDPSRTRAGSVIVIHNWADPGFVRPIPKAGNGFAVEHGLADTVNVVYSGNLGETHDLDTMLDAAAAMSGDHRVRFVIIGEGYRRPAIEARVRRESLRNVILLPFQREELLPYTLTCADMAVVTLGRGAEGVSFPSKTYYAMAAGSALLVVATGRTGLKDLVANRGCGVVVEPGDRDGFVAAVKDALDRPDRLAGMRRASRLAVESEYNRENQTRKYAEVLADFLH
jgi:glycosyltransferase involved in cell wall biosynthesis